MKTTRLIKGIAICMMAVFVISCSSDEDVIIEDTMVGNGTTDDTSKTEELTAGTSYDITSILSKLTAGDGMSYQINGTTVYIYSTGVPNHNSPYFKDTQWYDDKYEDNTNSGFRLNPNRIATHNFEFRIPLNPTVATNKTATNMGAMGVSINGVPFYNQYAAGGADLTNEIFSFDQYKGHPDGGSKYHYHMEPVYLTAQNGEDALLGVLLDGFPVYGPMENGMTVDSDDLDDYHGHFGATEDFLNGIYHYHITADAPYINGDGFYGTAGTVSN